MEQRINKSQQADKPNKNFSKVGFFIVAWIVCLLVILVSVGIYFQDKQKGKLEYKISVLQNQINVLQKQMSDIQESLTLKSQVDETDSSLEKQKEEEVSVEKISGEIVWTAPIEIPSLKIFNDTDNGYYREKTAKYYKVGEFFGEHSTKGDIVLVSASYERPAFYPGFYRFIKDGKTGEMILLEKYSDALYDGDWLDREKFRIDKTFVIPELEFPNSFNGPGSRQVLVINREVKKLFKSIELKKVFTDKNLGDVYTTADYPSSSSDVFSRHGFYIKAPDGTVRVYYLKVDFVVENNVPEITWNNGVKNVGRYSFSDVTGCGSSNYISVVSKDFIDVNKDLKPVGKNSKGDIIYELKDINHKLLKDFYKNNYWVPKNENKLPYMKFIKGHPIFFWIDPFGRLIKFESNKFVSPAECAKPVIYLYPEKTTDISVKIYPKGGMSYSDPVYNNGWIVRADNTGNLTDLTSGKIYPYLFWEGKGGIYEQPKKGFSVAREDVHNFLVEKLRKFGLNEKETTDFIEFWEPKMKESPYYFITFLGSREMEQIAPLDIEPKPDTVIRVLMDFSPLDNPASFEGFKIRTPERYGFTVVEWGGVLQ